MHLPNHQAEIQFLQMYNTSYDSVNQSVQETTPEILLEEIAILDESYTTVSFSDIITLPEDINPDDIIIDAQN